MIGVRTDGAAVTPHADAFAAQVARTDLAPGHLGVHRWYLRRPAGPVDAPAFGPDVSLLTAEDIPVPYYRFLYHTVGEDWIWDDRRVLADAALAAILARPSVSVTTLFVGGRPMGFYEIEASPARPDDANYPEDPDVAEVAYFGLLPWAIGQKLGPRLIAHAVSRAGGEGRALTINTCSLDHPRALTLYQEAGFQVTAEVTFATPDPRLTDRYPRAAAPHIPLARG